MRGGAAGRTVSYDDVVKWLRRLLTGIAVLSALSAVGLAVAARRNRDEVRVIGLRAGPAGTFGWVELTPAKLTVTVFDRSGLAAGGPFFVCGGRSVAAYAAVFPRSNAESTVDATDFAAAMTTAWAAGSGSG